MRAEILIRQRIWKLIIVLVALFGVVTARIVSLAVIQGEELTARGVRQWTREGKVAAQRGQIVDRNGSPLALSTTAYIVSVNPRQVQDAEAFAEKMSDLLQVNREQLLQKLQNRNYASVQIKRQVSRETVDQLRAVRPGGCNGAPAAGNQLFGGRPARLYPRRLPEPGAGPDQRGFGGPVRPGTAV